MLSSGGHWWRGVPRRVVSGIVFYERCAEALRRCGATKVWRISRGISGHNNNARRTNGTGGFSPARPPPALPAPRFGARRSSRIPICASWKQVGLSSYRGQGRNTMPCRHSRTAPEAPSGKGCRGHIWRSLPSSGATRLPGKPLGCAAPWLYGAAAQKRPRRCALPARCA